MEIFLLLALFCAIALGDEIVNHQLQLSRWLLKKLDRTKKRKPSLPSK